MIHADLSPLANHLWQSTLCAAAVWVLTLAFSKNRASVRYCLWLTGSVKFLVPFSLLVRIGSQFGWRTAPAIPQAQLVTVMNEISRPFACRVKFYHWQLRRGHPASFRWSYLACGFAASY
jgi:hypothetical protein